jgi:wobble nucleotide-excising tRNase
MVVKKVISLKNVGRFKSLSARGGELRKLTLIYGSNGHGKTTLAGVLRSLATGDPAYVDERHTLGVTEPAEAEIRLAASNARFRAGTWSETAPDIEIFDSTFVNDNVFTGEHVGPEHRKNLYEVVVGANAVALARDIDDLDARSRKTAGEINDAVTQLQSVIQAPFSLDNFIGLVAIPELTEKIRDATTKLNAVRKQADILARAQINALTAPALPDISSLLAYEVEQLSETAAERVRQHLGHLDHRGEAWIRQGLGYTKRRKACPYCGQDTEESDLVKLYAQFFSTAYRDHVVAIEQATNNLDQSLGDPVLAALQKEVLQNDACIKGWADLADLSAASFKLDQLEAAWRHVRAVLRERLQRKAGNPSNAIADDDEMAAAIGDYNAARDALAAHSQEVTKANARIGDLKKQSAATNPETLEAELRRLRNIEIRQKPEVSQLVEKLAECRKNKKDIEDNKTAKKKELTETATQILAKYEIYINRLLKLFGANFTIVNAKPNFAGGKASSTYQLELNQTQLDIGDARTPRGKPCFRTALSTGDKSTLALAFFLARLEQENISSKCVIIDDPMSSFDSFRTACTKDEIIKVVGRAKQTVVLSHDATFLKCVYDAADRKNLTAFHIVRSGDAYLLDEWKLADYFLRQSHHDYFLLREYLDAGPKDGSLTSIARAIRPYIEGHLRHTFPTEFLPTEWLGEFIDKIRTASPNSVLAGLKPKLEELEQLNDYSKRTHHADQGRASPQDDTELRTFVERALAFVQT